MSASDARDHVHGEGSDAFTSVGVEKWLSTILVWLKHADQDAARFESRNELIWGQRSAPQAWRADFEDNVRVSPNTTGVDEGGAGFFIVRGVKLSLEASTRFDEDGFEALLEQLGGILGSDGDTLLVDADFGGYTDTELAVRSTLHFGVGLSLRDGFLGQW